jgi:hypothetical protein
MNHTSKLLASKRPWPPSSKSCKSRGVEQSRTSFRLTDTIPITSPPRRATPRLDRDSTTGVTSQVVCTTGGGKGNVPTQPLRSPPMVHSHRPGLGTARQNPLGACTTLRLRPLSEMPSDKASTGRPRWPTLSFIVKLARDFGLCEDPHEDPSLSFE